MSDQGPFCGATDCPYFGLCDPPHGFQSQGGSLAFILTCLHIVNLGDMSDIKPAFSTNRGVYGISVCTTGSPSGHPSCKQWRAGNCDLCSNEIWSCAARLTSKHAIHLAMPAGLQMYLLIHNVYMTIISSQLGSQLCYFAFQWTYMFQPWCQISQSGNTSLPPIISEEKSCNHTIFKIKECSNTELMDFFRNKWPWDGLVDF